MSYAHNQDHQTKKIVGEKTPLIEIDDDSINAKKSEVASYGTTAGLNKLSIYFDLVYVCTRYSLLEDLLKYLVVRGERRCIHPPINMSNGCDIVSVQLLENIFGNFLYGTRLVSETLYPALLSGMLISDIVNFCVLPQAKVGNLFLQFLYLFSDNRFITTSRWPQSWYIWSPTIVGSTVTSGIVSLLIRVPLLSTKDRLIQMQQNMIEEERQSNNENTIYEIRKENEKSRKKEKSLLDDDAQSFSDESISPQLISVQPNFAGFITALRHIDALKKRIILLDYDASIEEKDEEDEQRTISDHVAKTKCLEKINEYLDDDKFDLFTRLIAINALAKIVEEFRECRVKKLPDDKQEDCRKLRKQAIGYLKKVAQRGISKKCKNFSLENIYANHSLWSNGVSYQNGLNSLFWLPTFLALYTKYRLLLSIAQPLIKLIMLKINELICMHQSKVYFYMQSSGGYECTICGDWPEVYYNYVNDAQACLDSLLQTAQSPERVIAGFERVAHFGVSNIDLSRQNWNEWSDRDLQATFNATQQISDGSFDSFNLGAFLQMPQVLSDRQVEIIADAFGRQIEARNISFAGSYFPVNATAYVLDNIANHTNITSVVILSNMRLGRADFYQLSQSLANFTYLNTFIANDNFIDNESMRFLGPVLSQMNLTELGLAGGSFDGDGISYLSRYAFPNLQKLDLSDSNFASANLTSLEPLLENPSLSEFFVRNSGINVENLPTFINVLPRSNLRYLDMSYNYLTPYAGYELGAATQNSTLHTLILNGNSLSDQGVSYFARFLSNSPIRRLVLRRVGVTDAGIRIFSQYFPQSNIVDLDLEDNQITELGIRYFASSWAQNNVSSISFNGNAIGDEGLSLLTESIDSQNQSLRTLGLHNTGITQIRRLFKKLSNVTNLETLNIGVNNLEANDYLRAMDYLSGLTIRNLDLSNTGMNHTIANQLIQRIPGSSIINLNLDHNAWGNNVAMNLVKTLVRTPVSSSELMARDIIDENMRLIYGARPNTNLFELSLKNTDIKTEVARAICRILPSTKIDMKLLFLSGNDIDESQVNLINCHISSASRANVPALFTLIERVINSVRKSSLTFFKKIAGDLVESSVFSTAPDSSAIVPFVPLHNNKPEIFMDCVINDKGLLQCRGAGRSADGEANYFYVVANVMQNQLQIMQFKKLTLSCAAAIAFAFRDEIAAVARLFEKYFVKSHLLKDLLSRFQFYRTSRESVLINEFGSMIIRANCNPVLTLVHDVTYTTKKIVKDKKIKSESIITKAAKALLTLGGGFGVACAINYLTGNPLIGLTLMPVISKVPKIYQVTSKSYHKNGFWSAVVTAFDEFAYSVPGGNYFRELN